MICSLTSIPITALSSKLRQDIDSGPFIDEHKIFGNTTYSPVNQQFTYINHLAQWITKIEMFYHSDWKLYHGDVPLEKWWCSSSQTLRLAARHSVCRWVRRTGGAQNKKGKREKIWAWHVINPFVDIWRNTVYINIYIYLCIYICIYICI